MLRNDAHVGMLVKFGRGQGQQTLGKVVKVNPKKLKVEQLEARGVNPVGTVWNVPPSMCTPTGGATHTPRPTPTQGMELPTDIVGRTFRSRTRTYEVTGIETRRPKYPVTAKRLPDGKPFKFPTSTVLAGL
jgi:hypothetical protein